MTAGSKMTRGAPSSALTLVTYGLLSIGLLTTLVGESSDRLPAGSRLVWLVVLAAATAVSCGAVEVIQDRLGRAIVPFGPLAVIALVVSGRLAALIVVLLPDLLRALRRPPFRRSLGLMANVASSMAEVLVASWVLSALAPVGPIRTAVAVMIAGVALASVSYLVARLLFEVLRSGARPVALLRSEYLAMLPAELGMTALAVVSVLLAPAFGILALAPLAGIVMIPQLAMARLLGIRSVARLDVDTVASIYRAALGDELRLSRGDRRAIDGAAWLLERDERSSGGLASAGDRELRASLSYAVELEQIRARPRAQVAYRAHPCVQVLLIAEGWAWLTARNTRALSHPEALAEITVRELALDAPDALAAACAIAERETTLTAHSTAVPRLHGLPLPRRLRSDSLVANVERLRD